MHTLLLCPPFRRSRAWGMCCLAGGRNGAVCAEKVSWIPSADASSPASTGRDRMAKQIGQGGGGGFGPACLLMAVRGSEVLQSRMHTRGKGILDTARRGVARHSHGSPPDPRILRQEAGRGLLAHRTWKRRTKEKAQAVNNHIICIGTSSMLSDAFFEIPFLKMQNPEVAYSSGQLRVGPIGQVDIDVPEMCWEESLWKLELARLLCG